MVARAATGPDDPTRVSLPPPLAIAHQICRRWSNGLDGMCSLNGNEEDRRRAMTPRTSGGAISVLALWHPRRRACCRSARRAADAGAISGYS